MATSNGSTAIRDKILASLARYRALRIGKFPCAFWRLSSRPGLTAAVEEMAERGYASAEEADVRQISTALEPRLKHLMLSYEDAANQLVKEPANLEGTPFNDGELLGAHTGGTNHDGKWTDISRFYKFDDLGVVELSETDYITSRGRIQMTQELINEDVNGIPAMYRVNVSNSGAAVSLVSWATDSKKYVLYAEKNGAKDEGVKQRLLELARSIPAD
ncbi:hypothetical protein bplSymb_SCF11802P002 [Bathymodiolus platifrons methanotrophic gill symbiont]|uniref:hypothetical protein n=1 Tax=Bathymodiolus platifrons methanotrophic gill symbiont TaxID=113268 RepID=UPI000B41F6EC|nr:hypothetical protein [Bathymodiolus platifrons methanotrophic gill symbiont]GAW87622.1 hypothetical protein bplSymb_SCF11802P002 [Bathymodiolus platifrons methanotrophic gill symbiont]